MTYQEIARNGMFAEINMKLFWITNCN